MNKSKWHPTNWLLNYQVQQPSKLFRVETEWERESELERESSEREREAAAMDSKERIFIYIPIIQLKKTYIYWENKSFVYCCCSFETTYSQHTSVTRIHRRSFFSLQDFNIFFPLFNHLLSVVNLPLKHKQLVKLLTRCCTRLNFIFFFSII